MDADTQLEYWYEHVWAEDIDYRPRENAIDRTGAIRGRDAMRSYVADWFDTIDGFRFEPEDVLDAGNGSFVITLRMTGRVRGCEQQVAAPPRRADLPRRQARATAASTGCARKRCAAGLSGE